MSSPGQEEQQPSPGAPEQDGRENFARIVDPLERSVASGTKDGRYQSQQKVIDAAENVIKSFGLEQVGGAEADRLQSEGGGGGCAVY